MAVAGVAGISRDLAVVALEELGENGRRRVADYESGRARSNGSESGCRANGRFAKYLKRRKADRSEVA